MEKWYAGGAEEAPASAPGQDERTLAMLAHLLMVFSSFVGPLVLYLVKREQSRFVAFHALQAMVWQIAYFGIMIVAWTVMTATLFGIQGPVGKEPSPLFLVPFLAFWLLAMGLAVLNLVLGILFAIKANNGEWAEYPLLGRWARRLTG